MSVVYEYSILYTDRILQKTKNWKDGVLKFYTFNNRIDIHSLDGSLITTDFFNPSKSFEVIKSRYLYNNNEFLLPSGKFLVEIDEFIQTYERDISNMNLAKKLKRTSVKLENADFSNTPDQLLPVLTRRQYSNNVASVKSVNCTVIKSKIADKHHLTKTNEPKRTRIRIPRQSSNHFKYLKHFKNKLYDSNFSVLGGSRSMSFIDPEP